MILLRHTEVSRILRDLDGRLQCEIGIENIKMLRSWKNGDGFQKKAYQTLKNEISFLDKESLKTTSKLELLTILNAFRKGISERNKSKKPKWIQQ